MDPVRWRQVRPGLYERIDTPRHVEISERFLQALREECPTTARIIESLMADAPSADGSGGEVGGERVEMSEWIDVGGTTVPADQVAYVQDVRPEHGEGLARGMKSIVTLESGRWFYARFGRAAILRRIRTSLATQPDDR